MRKFNKKLQMWCAINVGQDLIMVLSFRPDFTLNLVQELVFGTPKFYIAPYGKIKHELVNLSSNCDVKSGLILRDVSAIQVSWL